MKRFFTENKPFLLLLLSYVLATLFVRPFGNYPLNDDWSYAISVLSIEGVGRLDIGEWPAMTLATHVVWGYLFTKVLGFSFLSLRISTWVSMCIGMYSLYSLGTKLSGNKIKAALMSAVLLYNPIYFNMSNTYMTDVNFVTLLILSMHLAYDFFDKPNYTRIIGMLVLSCAITLLRQFGIIVPVAFLAATIFLKERKWLWMACSALVLLITYYVFHRYEVYLKSYLTQWSAYKFSGDIKPFESLFWEKLGYGLSTRYKIVIIHMFFHTFMFASAFLPGVLKRNKWWLSVLVFAGSYTAALFLYDGYPLQVGNVFLDTAVGTDTTYETLLGTYFDGPHFFVRSIEAVLDVFKPLLIAGGFSVFVLHLIGNRKERIENSRKIFFFFIALILVGYLTLILITDSFFDRYQLPVILITLLAFAQFSKYYPLKWYLAAPLLAAWMYISIAGTHDYFRLNDKKWEMITELRTKENIPNEKIHGSFEQVCWNEGKHSDIWSFSRLKSFDYLIQFKVEDSFKLYREDVFKRYWPPCTDTLRVYKRYLFAKKNVPDSLSINDTIKK